MERRFAGVLNWHHATSSHADQRFMYIDSGQAHELDLVTNRLGVSWQRLLP